jgi:hypothetical protein
LTNIIDGMDAARFQSANSKGKKLPENNGKQAEKDMPPVLKNLKNGS